MLDKIKELIGSIRFWIATLAMLSLLAGHYLPSSQFLFDTISVWLGVVFGAGTLDSIATKVSSKKAE